MDLRTASKKLGIFSSLLSYVGAAALFFMMLLTTVDVAGRYILNKPITGVFELTEYLVLILIFSFLAITQAQGGHVSVDLFLTRLPAKLRFAVNLINHLICLALMAIIFWMGFLSALDSKAVGEMSPNLAIPKYPFVFFLALGCLILCIEYLRNIFNIISERKEDGQL
jgi:TRAP-type C4-dicarboxylate transport system permease small subunit